ncbi:apocytochrome f, partial [Striga asiatica]
MARTPKQKLRRRRCSFFKILFGNDFTRRLRIPPEFARTQPGALHGKVKLKISCGPTWAVSLEKLEDGSISFCRGWAEFVEAMELKLFDFLIFIWCAEKSTFTVSGYGKNGCPKGTFRRTCGRGEEGSVGLEIVVTIPNSFPRMARKPKQKLRPRRNTFFKILFGDDFTRRLRIPPEFARIQVGGLLGKVKLKISGGPTWAVSVEKMEDGSIWFCKGWAEFIDDMELKLFDFLIFLWCAKKSTFEVCGYGKNACGKGTFRRACGSGDEGSAGLENDLKEEGSSSDGEDEAKSGGSNPCFEIIMKRFNHVPKDFLLAAGLVGKEGVCLDYEGGHPAYVELISRPIGCVELVNGWPKFWMSNKLVLGNSYMFEFIPSKMMIRVHGENESSDDDDNSDADETKYPLHGKKRNGKGKNQEIVKRRKGKAKNQENMEDQSRNCDLLKEERPNFDGSSSDVKETWDAYQKAQDYVSSRTQKNPFFISFMHKCYVQNKHILNVSYPFARRNLPHLGTMSIILVTNGKEWLVTCRKGKRRAELLTIGWRKFVQDNGIKLGDVCVFEVADRTDNKGNELVMARTPEQKLRHRRNTFFKILFGDDFTRRLRIPSEFARIQAGALLGKVKLKISGGPTWDVSVEKMEDGSIWFCKGWAEFFEDMELKLFDFLIFLWCAKKSTFEVCGYGKNACAKGTFRRACCNGDEGSARLENDLKEEASFSDGEDEAKSGGSNPCFKIILKPYHQYRLQVPKDFLLAAGLVGKEGVCLDYEGGHPVCVELKSRRRIGFVEIVNGWPKFQSINKLVREENESSDDDDDDNSDADETKYPIHDKKRNGKGKSQEIMKKRKGKAKNQENMRGISSRLKEERPNFDGSSSDVKETWDAYQKAEAFVSSRTPKKPCFISFMHKTYVRNKHSLNVPFPFGRRNLPHLGILSIVLVTDGKEWLVKCLKREHCAKLLTAGWRKFVQDNEIKLGDACVFEVADGIDSKGNELQGYENPREATGRIVCANCHLASKPVDIEVPQAVLPDTVFEAVVRIPYDKQVKQVLANGKRGFECRGCSYFTGGVWISSFR